MFVYGLVLNFVFVYGLVLNFVIVYGLVLNFVFVYGLVLNFVFVYALVINFVFVYGLVLNFVFVYGLVRNLVHGLDQRLHHLPLPRLCPLHGAAVVSTMGTFDGGHQRLIQGGKQGHIQKLGLGIKGVFRVGIKVDQGRIPRAAGVYSEGARKGSIHGKGLGSY